ncbi:lipoyl(octanoyl) transferase LipB [Verrucomicrobiaceae bacterium N1E253]|uniref:Octanoyltransferase n=1 Tax=Oceaniferula marina TaxID=2748318 RepID=A0A851GFP1_9BACT|nr:lipoyl(octanoyl) transferase LipB [Oceaniferula marina]NWK54095.1 lipoyl(octanoyl) transferase LipB [Oceaniferula marina]
MRLQHQWLGQNIDYQQGLDLQNQCVQNIIDGKTGNQLLNLEHSPVYTIGRTRDRSSLGNQTSHLPHPVVEISRGGQATYHGPGQLTGYPIIDLHPLGNDLHAYIRGLEEALIRTCSEFNVVAGRREGLTGVWVENRKLASIGVGVRKWIALHGYAINITRESLNGFFAITPCGIDGVQMTCLENECGTDVDVRAFADKLLPHLESVLAEMQQARETSATK